MEPFHDNVTYKNFPHYWPFTREIHRSLVLCAGVMRHFHGFFVVNRVVERTVELLVIWDAWRSCDVRAMNWEQIIADLPSFNQLPLCAWSRSGRLLGLPDTGVFISKHCGRDKIDASSQTTFSNAFPWIKSFEFRLKFHWSLFPRVQLAIFQHLCR